MKKIHFITSITTVIFSSSIAIAHAQNAVKIHGVIDMYAGAMKLSGANKHTMTLGGGGLTTSWIGIDGQETISNNLKLSFKLDAFFRADTGDYGRRTGDTFFSRNANISIASPLGTITAGRSASPDFATAQLLNPLGTSFNFSPLILHLYTSPTRTTYQRMVPSDSGWSNQIIYKSPNYFGGLKINLHYQFGESQVNNKKNYSIQPTYQNKAISVVGYYARFQLSNPIAAPLATDSKSWMIGGSYDFGISKFFMSYGQTKSVAETSDKAKTAQVGASIPLHTGRLLASYAQTDYKHPFRASSTRRTATIGYNYLLSKNTDVYSMIMNDQLSNHSSGTSFAIGIRHKF